MRERGNIWPVIVVIAAALCVLVIVPLLIERQKAGRMATVDAYVSIGDGEVPDGQASAASNYRWPNGEVPRTAERLRDITAVAIAAATTMIGQMFPRSLMLPPANELSHERLVQWSVRRSCLTCSPHVQVVIDQVRG